MMTTENHTFTFVFVAMGQGDCTLVRCPDGRIVVVDCGSLRDSLTEKSATRATLSFEEAYSLLRTPDWAGGQHHRVAALILTHPDNDHCNKIYSLFGEKTKEKEIIEGKDRVQIDSVHFSKANLYNSQNPMSDYSDDVAGIILKNDFKTEFIREYTLNYNYKDEIEYEENIQNVIAKEKVDKKKYDDLSNSNDKKRKRTELQEAKDAYQETQKKRIKLVKEQPFSYLHSEGTKSFTREWAISKDGIAETPEKKLYTARGGAEPARSIPILSSADTVGDTADKAAWSIDVVCGNVKKITTLESKDTTDEEGNNAASLAIIFSLGEHKALLCGDATFSTEHFLVNERAEEISNVQLLMVGHHGSKNASTQAFIDLVKPKAAVVSCEFLERQHIHPTGVAVERILDALDEPVSKQLIKAHDLDYWILYKYYPQEKRKEDGLIDEKFITDYLEVWNKKSIPYVHKKGSSVRKPYDVYFITKETDSAETPTHDFVAFHLQKRAALYRENTGIHPVRHRHTLPGTRR
jgi:beta-lactamase superfamily II metal-dependent hydrolase